MRSNLLTPVFHRGLEELTLLCLSNLLTETWALLVALLVSTLAQ